MKLKGILNEDFWLLTPGERKAFKKGRDTQLEADQKVLDAVVRETLISVGKEAKRMDGTIYLIPDYAKYRQALKEGK